MEKTAVINYVLSRIFNSFWYSDGQVTVVNELWCLGQKYTTDLVNVWLKCLLISLNMLTRPKPLVKLSVNPINMINEVIKLNES